MNTRAVKILLYCCTDTRPNQGTKLRQPEATVIEPQSVDTILDKKMIFRDRIILAGSKGVLTLLQMLNQWVCRKFKHS